jgi:hypothetical protein
MTRRVRNALVQSSDCGNLTGALEFSFMCVQESYTSPMSHEAVDRHGNRKIEVFRSNEEEFQRSYA